MPLLFDFPGKTRVGRRDEGDLHLAYVGRIHDPDAVDGRIGPIAKGLILEGTLSRGDLVGETAVSLGLHIEANHVAFFWPKPEREAIRNISCCLCLDHYRGSSQHDGGGRFHGDERFSFRKGGKRIEDGSQ